MIIVNAKIVASESTGGAMRDAIAKMEAASQAEPGCHDYCFSVEVNNPKVMRITEKWENMEALATHFTLPHMADFQAAMAAHPPEDVQAHCFEATEVPLPGQS